MTEAFVWISITCIDFVSRVTLGSIIVCQLNQTLPITEVISVRNSLWGVVAEEVEVEFRFGLFNLSNHLHAEELVEFDCVKSIRTEQGLSWKRQLTNQIPWGPSLES